MKHFFLGNKCMHLVHMRCVKNKSNLIYTALINSEITFNASRFVVTSL